jgi:hypothetical protein
MLNFPAIKSAVEIESKAVLKKCNEVHQVCVYSSSGNTWKTAGFYTKLNFESRLVFEICLHEKLDSPVVRVFKENPLEIVFARKFFQETGLHKAVEQAGNAFISLLPIESVFQPEPEDSLDDLPFSEEEKQLLKNALNPIPPPMDLKTIPEI